MKKWLKLTFVATGLALLVGAGACACVSKQAVVAHAEEEIVEPVVEEEQPAEENSWLQSVYYTYIVPILASICSVSLGSILVCVGTTIIKSKLLDKKLAEIDERKNEILALAEKKYTETCEQLVEVQKYVTMAKEIYEYMKKCEVLNERMSQVVDKMWEKMGTLDKFYQANHLLIETVANVELKNPEAIKNGVAENFLRISEIVKSI